MFTEWLKSDIQQALDKSSRVVITDPTQYLTFALKGLNDYSVITLNRPEDEMTARLEAQTAHKAYPVILLCFFPSARLSHLREFAGVGGLINFDNPEQYLRDKLCQVLHEHTIRLPKEKLLFSAKVSGGKDLKWWKNIVAETIEPLDVYTYLPMFLAHNTTFERDNDEEVYSMFRRELYRMMGKPAAPVDAPTLLRELAAALFDGLTYSTLSKPLLELYYWWSNSSAHQPILRQQLDHWKLPADASPLKVHPDHPFADIDRRALRCIAERISQNRSLMDIKDAIERRIQSRKAWDYKPQWLIDIHALLSFDSTDIYRFDTLAKLTDYYRDDFSRLDTAMRHIYAEWLGEPNLLRPVQELYERHLKALLGAWFMHAPAEYQPSQFGLLAEALQRDGRVAVVVCDGLRLEMANAIAEVMAGNGEVTQRCVKCAQLPTVTENGMSALFGLDEVNTSTAPRFAALKAVVPDVEIISYSQLSDAEKASRLVLLFGDIDTIGENKQLAGLKDINGYEAELAEAVRRLHHIGYKEVFLTADHGFVITGLLDEASKVMAPSQADVHERFAVTDDAMVGGGLIRRSDSFPGGHYQYYAKTDRPFRSRGVYGYAHGGFTPQECLIPMYLFTSQEAHSPLEVSIVNKSDLQAVTGSYASVKLRAIAADSSSSLRMVKVILFSHGKALPGNTLVQMKPGKEEQYQFEWEEGIDRVVVVDADTQATIDSCEIKESGARDLGGLF